MITVLKIAVLLFCAVVAVVISCYSDRKKGTCILLAFFVGAGITTFFSEEAIAVSLVAALCAFLTLSVLTAVLSQMTMHRKNEKEEREIV